jgi:hypothetical protein
MMELVAIGVAMSASGAVKTIVDAHGNLLHRRVFQALPKKLAGKWSHRYPVLGSASGQSGGR